MNVNYSDAVREWPEGYSQAQRITVRLLEELGPDVELKAGEWDKVIDERRREGLTLRVLDDPGELTATFAADELRSPSLTAYRVHRLCFDILHARTGQMLHDLHTAGAGA